MVGTLLPTTIQTYGKFASRIFIKSVVDQTNLQLGMVIVSQSIALSKKVLLP